jgi:hypothetical protein
MSEHWKLIILNQYTKGELTSAQVNGYIGKVITQAEATEILSNEIQ